MSLTVPALMSSADFVKQTTPKTLLTRARRRLVPIDIALAAWHDAKPGLRELLSQNALDAVTNIIGNCQAWLKARETDESKTLNLRRPVVMKLLGQATMRLTIHRFTEKKAEGKKPTKALAPGYQQELAAYIERMKGLNPPSGSTVHFFKEWFADPINKDDVGRYLNRMDNKVQAALGKDFEDLTLAEYETLFSFLNFDAQLKDQLTEPVRVQYLRKQDRLRFMYWVADGKLVNAFGLFTTTGNKWMYAMDQYGNLFSTQKKDAKEKAKFAEFESYQATKFNHSSFNAGKEIVCAGELEAVDGVLQYIDNASGHYQPTREHLKQCVATLQGAGLNLAHTRVGVMEKQNGEFTLTKMTVADL